MIQMKLFLLILTLYICFNTSYAIPPNSHSVGSSWECNIGYKKQGRQCNKIFIPPNAVPKHVGWACKTGFKRVKNQCNKVAVGITKAQASTISKNNLSENKPSQSISAQLEILEAAFMKAVYSKNGDNKAAELFRPLLKVGNATAQLYMAIMYAEGAGGLPKDENAAVVLWKKSAKQGNKVSAYNLGNAYRDGKGVSTDYDKATYWYEKSALKGHKDAQHNLGTLYLLGEIPKDYKKAMKWLLKAAKQDHINAHINIGLIYKKGEGVPKDYQKARQWFKKAADMGDPEARAYLGRLYCEGKGVEKNLKQCKSLVREAYYVGSTAASNTWKIYKLWK